MKDQILYFNGIDFDTRDYYRPPMKLSAFLDGLTFPREPDPLRSKDPASWVDPLDLAESGWGIIVHEQEDPEVLEAIEPLVALRRGQAGEYFRSLTFLEQDRQEPRAFSKRYNITNTDVDPENAPYYLLIVGSPKQIPFDFQADLDVNHAVGRICFERAEDYATYANNVVETEAASFSRKSSMVLFGSENDKLTELCTHSLVFPLTEKLKKTVKGWQFHTVSGPPANKKRLEGFMGGPDTPAILFTSGHGLTFSKNAERRFREQGSLICSDWEGPGAKIGQNHYFGPEDVRSDADFRGSIFFHFSCYTKGIPEFCGCTGPRKTRRLHDYPFITPLASRLLAHKRGPLAIIGHVDQAFHYSFLWDDKVHEISHFASTFHKLSQGFPVGAAMEPFNRRFAAVGVRILDEILSEGLNERLTLQYWLGYNDARNYLVLGDPAVRIRVHAHQPKEGSSL